MPGVSDAIAHVPSHSLKRRLPALIGGLCLLALVIVVYAAWREVHATLERGAGERARQAARQVAAILGTSASQTVTQVRALAPALRAYLEHPDAAGEAGARATLAALQPSPRRRVTVWDASGRRLFDLPPVPPGGDGAVAPPARQPAPGIGRIEAADGQAFADTVTLVPRTGTDTTAPIGAVSLRSVLGVTPPDALTRLVGGDARILFGNIDGDVWSDMTRLVAGPAIDRRTTAFQLVTDETGTGHIGAASMLAGTPWVVWVDFPRAAAVAGAQTFLQRMSLLVLAVAIASVLLVRRLLGDVTTPLAAMTTAAEAVAAGDYTRRVDADRTDEIGRLGRAFNAMSRDVEHELAERRRALEQLGEREEQLRHYALHSPVAVAMFDREMRYLVASRRWVEEYGLDGQNLVGRVHYDVIPNVPERQREVHRRCLAGAFEGRDEDPFTRPDGTTLWVRWEIRPWRQADGTIGGIVIFTENITARKDAESALRASEGRYRTLFDYAPDGILIADAQGGYVDANPSLCRMLDYPRERIIGMSAVDIVVPEEVPNIEPALDAITTHGPYQREWKFRRRDGSVFDADVFATQMPDGNLLAMVRDITDRNHATEAVRVAEERMRFALESAGVGIWDADYRTGVVRWSEILEAQYGLAPGTFPGTFDAATAYVHPDDLERTQAAFAAAAAKGGDFSLEFRIVRPDGAVRWMTGAGQIHLGPDGQPARGVGISIDVTARQTLEAQFQQAQKMEAVGRLAGGVAHDFNNLLTAILGYCELLLDELRPEDPIRAEISEIHKAGSRAAELTRQLLAFSRKQIIEPTTLDMNHVVRGLESMLQRLISEEVTVKVALGDGPLLFTADRGQVEQIIVNLAVNARDAMPRGGTLTIETARVELDDLYASTHFNVAPGSYVALTMTDTGTGMTPEVQAHLFEPFFTTKEQGKGTGLGLATVHGVVTRSGGSVGVYSEVGRGTSFKVYFPRATAPASAEAVSAPRDAHRGDGHTVLVVDDAEGLRTLMTRTLERRGYRVHVAANAQEALALFDTQPGIDVLLTDVVMPGASGPELTTDLLTRRPGLKVIYMSGYTEDAIVHHGVLKPGIAFLHKPFTADALGQKIREVLAL